MQASSVFSAFLPRFAGPAALRGETWLVWRQSTRSSRLGTGGDCPCRSGAQL